MVVAVKKHIRLPQSGEHQSHSGTKVTVVDSKRLTEDFCIVLGVVSEGDYRFRVWEMKLNYARREWYKWGHFRSYGSLKTALDNYNSL
jgi:hypothetical protein